MEVMTDVEAPRGLGRDYWRLWTADGLSNLADGILKVALPLVALGYTDSPALIAGLAFVITLPWLLFALPVGALVDRVDRRRAMLAANAVRAAAVAVVTVDVAAGHGSIAVLYATASCVGVAETVYDTAAQSILPQIVPRDRLPAANGKLFAVELTAHEFVGPPLAGVLVAAGATVALATPLGMWALAVGAMLLLHGSFRPAGVSTTTTGSPRPSRPSAPPRHSLRADIAEGVRFVAHDRLLRTLALMTGAFNFATNSAFAVFVLYATGAGSEMHLSKQSYGFLLATIAAGSVLGSFVADRLIRTLGRSRTLALSIPSGALLVGLPALTADPVLIGAGFFLGGVTNMAWNVVAVSLRQRLTPDRLLGRVNSAYRLLAWGAMPIGSAVGGLLAQVFGLRAVFAVAAAVMLALLTGVRVLSDRAMDEAERRADHEQDTAPAPDLVSSGE